MEKRKEKKKNLDKSGECKKRGKSRLLRKGGVQRGGKRKNGVIIYEPLEGSTKKKWQRLNKNEPSWEKKGGGGGQGGRSGKKKRAFVHPAGPARRSAGKVIRLQIKGKVEKDVPNNSKVEPKLTLVESEREKKPHLGAKPWEEGAGGTDKPMRTTYGGLQNEGLMMGGSISQTGQLIMGKGGTCACRNNTLRTSGKSHPFHVKRKICIRTRVADEEI